MANRTNLICLAIAGAELFAGVTMLAGYQAWVEPGAPRHKQQSQPPPAAAPAAAVPPPAVIVAPPLPAQPTPPPAEPIKVLAPARKPRPLQQPRPAAAKPNAAAAPVAPVPVAMPQPRQLPAPAAVPAPPPPPPPPPSPVSITQRGIEALNARNFASAVTLLRQARTQQPANADLGYLLGMALESTGELGAAIDAFRSCTSGPYESIARSHVKALAKRLGK